MQAPILTPFLAPPGAAGAAAGAKRKATEAPVPGARAKMAQMFQAAAVKARPARQMDDKSTDELLEDILGGLDANKWVQGLEMNEAPALYDVGSRRSAA